MDPSTFIDPNLTQPDRLVLDNLIHDIKQDKAFQSQSRQPTTPQSVDSGYESHESGFLNAGDAGKINGTATRRNVASTIQDTGSSDDAQPTIEQLKALNNPSSADFEPTVFVSWDLANLKIPRVVDRILLQPYIKWAKTVVRNETDVVMLTHLILYFTTSVPSAIYLFYSFTWVHGVLHWLMQSWFVGTYTLMMHQHIHMRGILAPKYSWFDHAFPYITDPLMGHTWNSYFYHHVKHHHVEGNGPDDLSSTIRYQRDDFFNFLHYVGRFILLIWFELPRYFIRKGQPMQGLKAAASEFANYSALIFLATYVDLRPTIFVFILPLSLLRLGLMVGNWGQHALVDEVEPDSDFRSSITLIDVASNRFCYNDGYHTSHHLNPRRHWREHPVAFLSQKETYAKEQALVFRNIDYVMLTVRVLRKDYNYLAKCLVPMGSQIGMTHDEIATMLRSKTRRFTEEDIQKKFR